MVLMNLLIPHFYFGAEIEFKTYENPFQTRNIDLPSARRDGHLRRLRGKL